MPRWPMRTRMNKTWALPLILLLAACAPGLQNLGEEKVRLIAYHDSGAYDRALAAVDADAVRYVESVAGTIKQPAIVLDIDETSLTNWPQIVANDFGYIPGGACDALPAGPCGAKAWEMSGARGSDRANTVAIQRRAGQGRGGILHHRASEDERVATEKNLRAAGYDGWRGLVLKTGENSRHGEGAAGYKAPQRAAIEAQGFHIIANVGDQPSDLAGGHAVRTFLLPNPFYRID